MIKPRPALTAPDTQPVPTITGTVVSIPTIRPTNQVNPTSTSPLGPWFSPKITFYVEPDPQKSQRVFPAGIRQVFAIWDFANLENGMLIRREWYKDGELLIAQEDRWDYTRYGSQGTIADITIQNFEEGLQPGLYSLRLYIDRQEQTLSTIKDQASFRIINEKSPLPVTSPDGTKVAIVPEPRSLIIRQANGQTDRLFVGQEISRLDWFPDNQHIVISNRDRSKQDISGTPEGIREELWIVNTQNGMRTRIATPEENFRLPLISPDGRYIAALAGSGRMYSCESDLSVVILELDNNLTRTALHPLNKFIGFPDLPFPPIPINHPSAPLPGIWQENNRFIMGLKYPCTSGEADGVYLFDLNTWKVNKIQ